MEGSADEATDHFVPCTAGENETCQIVNKLSTWNELLLGSQFELREMKTAGQLSLSCIRDSPRIENFDSLRLPQYPELIGWLLRTHNCIASVYVSAVGIASLSVLEALRHSAGTKTVIFWFEDVEALNAAFEVITCLTKTEELHCGIHYDAALDGFMTALSALLEASTALKSLTLSCLQLMGPMVDTLFTHLLLSKHKLKELVLDHCELSCDSYPNALNEYIGEPDDRLVDALRLLPKFQHVTDLSIELRSGSRRLYLALKEYLTSTTALHNLELSVRWNVVVDAEGANPWWSAIHESLSRNKSLKKLRVSGHQISAQDIEGLADAVKRSQSITWVMLINVAPNNASVFVRRLSKGIADNWTLLFVHCWFSIDVDAARDWFAVCETTRRNCGIVARAARFMKASLLDRYVVGALEHVSRYPVLLDEVAELANIDRSEIVDLVRDRLKSAETLDGFMRVVGVVRERVVCHPPDEDRMQLDDLIEDCWRHVRRFLMIYDVKHSIRQMDKI
ncbi:hypothetical protein HPB49_024704 [Dermacentor silvarum]|uniref:Uncharacterized protein n=1 Tax=Dermacentor silvarum TaxID=543639 RepID=A0ACB8DS45_DERSI|nr:hypothetical protein HPB49_024704 [Dermacentor silvarum]